MIYAVVIIIISLFFIFALVLSPIIKKYLEIKVCAICAACSLTWLSLFTLKQLNLLEVDSILIGVLMGGSVVGIMFELEKYFKKNDLKYFWLMRILEVSGGYLIAYLLASSNFDMIGVILIILLVLTLTFIFLTKNKKKKNRKKESKEDISRKERKRAIEKLEKGLEDCC